MKKNVITALSTMVLSMQTVGCFAASPQNADDLMKAALVNYAKGWNAAEATEDKHKNPLTALFDRTIYKHEFLGEPMLGKVRESNDFDYYLVMIPFNIPAFAPGFASPYSAVQFSTLFVCNAANQMPWKNVEQSSPPSIWDILMMRREGNPLTLAEPCSDLSPVKVLSVYPNGDVLKSTRTSDNTLTLEFDPSYMGTKPGSISDKIDKQDQYSYDLVTTAGFSDLCGRARWNFYPRLEQPVPIGQKTLLAVIRVSHKYCQSHGDAALNLMCEMKYTLNNNVVSSNYQVMTLPFNKAFSSADFVSLNAFNGLSDAVATAISKFSPPARETMAWEVANSGSPRIVIEKTKGIPYELLSDGLHQLSVFDKVATTPNFTVECVVDGSNKNVQWIAKRISPTSGTPPASVVLSVAGGRVSCTLKNTTSSPEIYVGKSTLADLTLDTLSQIEVR